MSAQKQFILASEFFKDEKERDNDEVKNKFAFTAIKYYYQERKPIPYPIFVLNKDCLDLAGELIHQGKKILLLNMGNPTKPCGFPSLQGGQEEEICRRTSLCVQLKEREKLYPIQNNEFIFTVGQVAFSSFKNNYKPIEPFSLDIMTCPAVHTQYGLHDPKINEIMKRKIFGVLDFASKNHYVPILGAFGCGGFCHDPELISSYFRYILPNFSFSEVYFAILDFENHEKSNFSIFSKNL